MLDYRCAFSPGRILLAAALTSAALVVSTGCGRGPQGDVVAVVGTARITQQDLRTFVLGLLPGLRTDKNGQEAREDYLQTLIDRELMLLEAYGQGLDTARVVTKKLEAKRRDYVISIYRRREILPQIAVSEDEIHQYYVEQGMERERLLTAILVEEEEEARQLVSLFEAGHGFDQLANDHSLDRRSARKGGLVGFISRSVAEHRGIGAAFDSLPRGAISSPLPYGERFQLVRFEEDRSVDLKTRQDDIRRSLSKEKREDLEAQKTELLAYELGWHMAPEGLALLRAKAASLEQGLRLEFSDEEREIPLFVYTGGRVTIDAYIDVVHERRIKTRQAVRDSALIGLVAHRYILLPTMLMEAASRLRIQEEPEVLQWVEHQRVELLLKHLHQREVSARVSVSDGEVRQYYDDNPEIFRLAEAICFDELITPTIAEARTHREKITEDTSLLELARDRGLRTRRRGPDGLVCLDSHREKAFPLLWKALKSAPVGEVVGPIAVSGGFAIFKVVRYEEPRQEPFERAQRRARGALTQRAERQHFDDWITELRQKHQDEVTTYPRRLTEALPDALLVSGSEEL